MDRGGLIINELDGPLYVSQRQRTSSETLLMLVSPYRNTVYAPFQGLRAETLPLNVPPQRYKTFGRDVDVCVGLDTMDQPCVASKQAVPRYTSTVSKTLMTPGCRSVRSFFRAFFARGSWYLLAVMSKEKMLQFEPSSCEPLSAPLLFGLSAGGTPVCVPASCHCAGSRSTGRRRRCRRRSTGRQGPWRSQMRRRISGNPWRQGT